MDLLKDITRGLRGNHESRESDGQTSSPPSSRTNSSRRDAASGGETLDADSLGDESANDDRSQAETHVCSFCETEFDADRGACPDCEAELVFRGER